MPEGQGDNYRMWWDESKQVGRNWVSGHINVEIAEFFAKQIKEICLAHGTVNFLCDLSEEIRPPSAQARKIIANAIRENNINKMAFVGASVIVRTVANFITRAADQKNARHFAKETEAMQWLQEDNK